MLHNKGWNHNFCFCCLEGFSPVNYQESRLCFFREECAWRCEGLLQWSFTSLRPWWLQRKSLPHGIQWNLNLLFLASLIGYDSFHSFLKVTLDPENFLLETFLLLLLSVSSSEESIISATSWCVLFATIFHLNI